MRGLGAMMAGGDRGARHAHDLYDTPWEATEALYRAEYGSFAFYGEAWDPAVGNGALLDVLSAHGVATVGTDLIRRGIGLPGSRDFLKSRKLLGPMIVTNPPFRLAAAFIKQAMDLEVPYLALLLKSTFFHAKSRRALFEKHRPARIRPLSWRPDFNGKRAPTMECMWVVWEFGYEGPCVYGTPLEKPRDLSPFHLLPEMVAEVPEGAA